MLLWILKGVKAGLGIVVGRIPEEKKKEAGEKVWKGFIEILDTVTEAGARGMTKEASSKLKEGIQ